MSIFWISALRAVPWDKVLAATPGIVKAADSLWNSVLKKPAATRAPVGMPAAQSSEDSRIDILERELVEVRAELMSSAQIIQSLAGQNAQLVQAVDSLRRRVWLVLAGVLGLAIVVFVLMR